MSQLHFYVKMSFIAFGPNCGHRGLVKSDRWAHCRTGWPLTVWPFALLMLIFASSTALLCLPCSCCGKGGGRDGGKKTEQEPNWTHKSEVKCVFSFLDLHLKGRQSSCRASPCQVNPLRWLFTPMMPFISCPSWVNGVWGQREARAEGQRGQRERDRGRRIWTPARVATTQQSVS